MSDENLLYKEIVVGNNKKARWPYNTSLPNEEKYNTVMTALKEEKVGYSFEGWKFNDDIKPEPFNDESTNPFGPITGNTTILAQWSKIYVFCVANKNTVGYQGDTVRITYYAVTKQVINSSEVTLHVDTQATTMPSTAYQMGADGTSGDFRSRDITIRQNDGENGRDLVLYAEYKGVKSELVYIHQQSASEVVIPDSDYFIFNYEWTFDDKGTSTDEDDTGDGKDLDSLTVIYVEDKQGNRVQKSFTGIPVGYRGNIAYVSMSNYVVKNGNLIYMQHGGDNKQSGAEGAIICLSNIAKSGEISNLEKIIIKIYANWYERRIDGNMKINCKAFKSLPTSSGKYTDDIEQDGFEFKPKPENCVCVWNGFNRSFNVKAYGSANAVFENSFIDCIGNVYSNICSVVFDVGSGNKSWIPRTVDNGINSKVLNVSLKNDDNNTSYTLNELETGTEVKCEGIYLNYWGNNVYMFENNTADVEKDKIVFVFYYGATVGYTEYFYYKKDNPDILKTTQEYSAMTTEEKSNYEGKYYLRDNPDVLKTTDEYNSMTSEEKTKYAGPVQRLTVKASDLGRTFNNSECLWLKNLRVTKNSSDKKITVKFNVAAKNNIQRVEVYFLKYFNDCTHPVSNKYITFTRS